MMSANIGDATETRPNVFLSSAFWDWFDGKPLLPPLRQRILAERDHLPIKLWAYELFWPENSEKLDPDADTIIDRCFAGIRECDLFVFLLTGRHGSGVTYFHDSAEASFLELELFAASALHKPILVLHERGHEPEDALRDTMILLGQTFTPAGYVLDDENGLHRAFLDACSSLRAGSLKFDEAATLARLPEWLSLQRTRRNAERDLLDPRLAFLGGGLRAGTGRPNPDLAAKLLEQVSLGIRPVMGHERPLPHGAALFRLWAAMRELMDQSGRTLEDPAIAVLWDRAFGLWATKASWFGLHGHLWMGPLAAINSQISLRQTFASSREYVAAGDVREPVGARASAIYSIAQRMVSRRRKLFHYRQVALLSTQVIDRNGDSRPGALSIRGHALMRMAQLGRLWNLWGALGDFRKSLDLRIAAAAKPASIGEAMCDLGYCYALTRRRGTGLSFVKEGVSLLRSDQTPNGLGFLARGLRKLEDAARLLWRAVIGGRSACRANGRV